jgi:hypothetical protein
MQNETARPAQDSAVMALNARSFAIEEIVFIPAPLLARKRALKTASLEQKPLCEISGDR